ALRATALLIEAGPKIKCPESQGGALGADEAEPGEGFDSGGSLREVSEPGTPLRASEALDGVARGKFKSFLGRIQRSFTRRIMHDFRHGLDGQMILRLAPAARKPLPHRVTTALPRKSHNSQSDAAANAGLDLLLNRQAEGQCASPQLLPDPISTSNGTSSSAAPCMRRRTPSRTASSASSRTSNTNSSWTCISMCASSPRSSSQPSMAAIARLMMSAAVPCIGALIAARSAPARWAALREWM